MESQPQNPEFRNNPENFHPCIIHHVLRRACTVTSLSLNMAFQDSLQDWTEKL